MPAPGADLDALLALSRDVAEARTEDELGAAVTRALERLFPDRPFAIRLIDPRTLALTSLRHRGPLRSPAPARLELRRAAIRRVGLSEEVLGAAGVLVTEEDAPIFERCEEAVVVPLAVGGQLFGVLNLEYEAGAGGAPALDAPLLYQVANHAAVAVRNLRSLEELTVVKGYLEDVIEHGNALIAVVSRAREVLVWNAALAALTGFAREEVVGRELCAVVPSEERPRLDELLVRGFGGDATTGFETRLARKGGGDVRVSVNTAPVRGAGGEVEGVVAIGQDLTPLRSLQAAAEHAERLAGIGRLAAGVVHELNNPLTAVTMYADALLEKLTLARHDPADIEKLRAIKDAGARIQKLARDLVSYARPGGARLETLDVGTLLDDAARMAKPALREADAKVELRLGHAPEIEGNRASLTQVFVNLVTNAAQAVGARGGGTVVLEVERIEGGVRAAISDSGEGMPPDVRDRAFEPFFTTRPGRGIGLGLPIVLGIVQRHGGAVEITTTPGAGTRVEVTLPLHQR